MTSIITRDDLRNLTPSDFATTPWEGMSDSYRFIPTAEVLDMMAEQGFQVASARQSRTRVPGKADFTCHMLRLRHDSFVGDQGEVPEVVLINSHDRSSAYRVFSGVFRLVCENGLIVQSTEFGSFSIRHSGSRDLFAQVREATAHIMEGAPAIMNRIDAWKQIILPRRDQLIMAAEAFALKPIECIKPSFLLTARREEDYTDGEGNRDLWRTTNVIQESLMRGGLSGVNARGRKVTSRAVKAVEADLRINRRLWELAETFSLNAVVRPRVRLFRIDVHRCTGCGETVRGRHPELAADQRGATAHRLGPRLLAAAHHLNYGLGVPVRKLPAVRALRPAVIARKVSQCTKTARGTRAFEAWTSVLRTLSRTTSGPALLDAVVRLTHPLTAHPP